MGYLSCRAESSISTCHSISPVTPAPTPTPTPTHKKKKKKKKDKKKPQDEEEEEEVSPHRHIRHFTYRELESATNNFSEDSLLGRGSHGSVYKAILHNTRRPVAVKRSSRRPTPTYTTRNEVDNEIDILSQIYSPRLVNLIGFTASIPSRKARLLVVEFMPNGTLYDFLHSNPCPPDWPRRLRLALQTAKALLTLHSARPPVIHRDVKSANILIDRNFKARLGDFGLALRLDDDDEAAGLRFPSSARSTPPAGTLGYLDPCYITPDNLSTKTDVFSFGILLLEIMSGRKAIDVAHSPPSIVEWAVPLLRKGKVSAIYDPRIAPPKDSAARRQLALLAASCVRSYDERRPSMEEVVEQLEVLSMTVNLTVWNGLSVVNPCSVVETERTLSKLNPNGLNSDKNPCRITKCKAVEETDTQEEEMVVGVKKPFSSSNSPSKVVCPLRNGRRVFSDSKTKRGCRNLKELLARLDGETNKGLGIEVGGSRSSVLSRARTLLVTRDYYDRGGMVRLRRNQTVKGAPFQSFSRLGGLESSDGRLPGRAGDVI